MKRQTKDFLLNNIFRFIQLGFTVPLGVCLSFGIASCLKRRFDLSYNNAGHADFGLVFDSAEILALFLLLMFVSVIIITHSVIIARILASRGESYLGYSKWEIIVKILLTLAVAAVYSILLFVLYVYFCIIIGI